MNEPRPDCVALVTPAWPIGAQPNGIVSYTSRLTAAFRELGVTPVILSWEVQPGCADSGVVDIRNFDQPSGAVTRAVDKLRNSLAPPFVPPQYQRSLRRAFENAAGANPIQILQMEEAFGHAVGLIRMKRVPIVVRLHGPWFLNGEVNGAPKNTEFFKRVAAERQAIVSASAITAPSLDVLKQTREYYELPLASAAVIPNPIDLGEFRETWSLGTCDRNRIVFIGRFDRHKGADVLLDAFVRIARRNQALSLDFIGPDRGLTLDNGSTIKLADYLEQKVPPEIRARIQIHGAKPPATIREFRHRGLVTVVPSRYETFGNTALETLAGGGPVIASNVGGLAEIVRHDETGLLVPPGDPVALAQALERIVNEPGLAERLGSRGRQEVTARFSPRTIAEQTLDFYAEVRERGKKTG